MPRSHRRVALLSLVLLVLMALAGPAAQAREASSLLDTLSAQFATWTAGWWPWSVAKASASRPLTTRTAKPVAIGGSHGPGAPVRTTDCVYSQTDPNGCPPPG
jgi:hypothetical protein